MPADISEGRRTIDTVLGPIKVVPECKAQAVCVNGSKCWEAGRCLRSRCSACGGSGHRNGNKRAYDPFGECPACHGTGTRSDPLSEQEKP